MMMKYAVLPLFLLMPLWTLAQTTITTRVIDAESGEPLPLVGVYVSEDNNTLTNFDGEFTLTLAPEDVVRLTYVGRETLTFKAAAMPAVVKMRMLDATLPEVTVTAVEGMLLQVAKKAEKTFKRRKKKEAQYFYRQTSVFATKQDIVEAFVGARSAVNLRELQFLTGRHGLLSKAAWNRSNIEDMNLHHLLEIAPLTREARFWNTLVAPLHASGISYLQHYYDITVEEIDGPDQHLYRFNLQRSEAARDAKEPIMTGALYVDRKTLEPQAFDGQVENLQLRFGKGELRSATVVPMTFDFHIDYSHDRKFTEVADLLVQARWGDFSTRTLLFNVERQKHLRVRKDKGRAKENMLSSIAEAGYDSTFWANNEVVKRTAEEQAIAQGSVDLAQARMDSVAAYQASLPPLQRLADRLERFGNAIPQEKVYVHMDNTSYFLGDTIWFAAYLRKTNTDTPSRMSRVLYAELWNHDGYLVERKLIEMKDGRGHGFFELPDTLYSGYFELRAYTRWQLNWGQTEHFHAWYTEYSFYNKAMAKDFFRDYEKLYSRVFPVYDKPRQPGDFYRDMTLRPLRRYFKSAPKPAELRLSLFPEGGNLVAGVPCRVAFEAATSEGEVREGTLSLQVKNERVKSEKNKNEKSKKTKARGKEAQEKYKEILSVRTENRGRGTFTFTPEEGTKYEAVFRPTPDLARPQQRSSASVTQDGLTFSQPVDTFATREGGELAGAKTSRGQESLPSWGDLEGSVSQTIANVKSEGVSLQVHRDSLSGNWRFDIAAAGKAAEQPLGLTVMHEGKLVHFEEVANTAWTVVQTDLPTGVNQVTVFDSIGHIYADRLFFVTQPELAQPTLQYTGFKDEYAPFEPIDIDITSAHLMPDQTVSLTVRDAVHADNTFDSGNIMTEMLLSSEIKGFVPQPDYFFEKDDAEHRRALDLLMLTQGWRRFNWQEMAIKGAWNITHPSEHTQIVTGTVNRYWNLLEEGDYIFGQVQADHERFMMEWTPSLSEQPQSPLLAVDGQPAAEHPADFHATLPVGYSRWNMAWNLNPIFERRSDFGAISDTWHGIYSLQGNNWVSTDYNVLSFRTDPLYQQHQRKMRRLAARRYIERGTAKKETRVHAEFINLEDERDFLVGETETRHGTFQIDLPRFYGKCVFFLGASDTTKWHKKWEGLHRRRPHTWVQMDDQDEYDLLNGRLGEFPEYYVRLNFHYPRWIKPYTYYQVHNASLRDTTYLSPHLLTDGTHVLDQITVRTRHGGLRRVDLSKPAYVIDAYQARNEVWDAGLFSDYPNAIHGIAGIMVGDMAMYRHYNTRNYLDGKPEGYWYGPLERMRFNLLTYLDKYYIYTDYSPRREGDQRYEQSNQPEVVVDRRRFPDGTRRVVYRDRRYILDGFAYQEDFYHPDYKRNPPTEGQKDYRRTLYWNPDLKLDASGRAHISLFNNSQTTHITVDAAGQTSDGSLLFSTPISFR